MTVQDRPFLSVCIPAYNRAGVLRELLDSIAVQDFAEYEIVICEDSSKERDRIRTIVQDFSLTHKTLTVRYFENETNLGYDNNLKELIRRAAGRFCVFMGNDDLLADCALSTIARTLRSQPNAGVFLRTYAAFNVTTDKIDQVFRYFPEELAIEPGVQAITLFFRRSVVIPGLTLDRDLCLSFESNAFDGSLLYQLYLVGLILAQKGGVYSPEVVTLYRNGGVPEFGNAASERGKFVPNQRTPESSIHFIDSMLAIARHIQNTTRLPVYKGIFQDMACYSYPFISVQADKGKWILTRYAWGLARLGFYKSAMFWGYYLALLIFGTRNCDTFIRWVKAKLGRTPKIGYTLSKV